MFLAYLCSYILDLGKDFHIVEKFLLSPSLSVVDMIKNLSLETPEI